jgi:KDO2-lipid IV(A) lauroyltransferase
MLGGLAHLVSTKHRRRARQNLRAAFPEWSEAQVRSTARQVFRNFGVNIAEFFKAPSLSAESLWKRVQVVGEEHLQQALRQKRGVLLITGHFGNWELAARCMVQAGYELSVIARDTNDPSTTELVTLLREKSGYKVLSRGSAARAVLNCLKKNEGVAILPDQNAGDVFVEFFGQKAGCVAGPAVLHLHTGAPLLPVFNVRLPGDYHRIEVLPPMSFEPSGNKIEDHRRIMQALHDVLEAYIRRYPGQWLWLHDRWKAGRHEKQGRD